MADADALERALRPLLSPGPVVLDGYPRTTRQLAALPQRFSTVMLLLEQDESIRRANRAAAASGKTDWDPDARWRQQASGLDTIRAYVDLVVNVKDKTPGEVAFEILSSKWIGTPSWLR